ncbi:hypothetical protein [Bartonella grahamii]|uniref:hypothetical protein n=1 Tax=Bartonella grahamii TaxID=33045 RepID=UPI0023600BD8|nr:hypothetical protein [Bartonella grahamii]
MRQIKASYAAIESIPFTSLFFSRMQKIIHIIGRRAKALVEKLHKAIGLLEWILQRFFLVKNIKNKIQAFR